MLTDEEIIKFQNLYKESFGKEIGREEAYEKGIKLLNLMSAVYRPMSEKEYQLINKHRQDTFPSLQKRLNF